MVFQAFVDESYSEGGHFVMAGCIASADAWANFSAEWEKLLPWAPETGRNGKRRFKHSEMRANSDIAAHQILAFYRVLEATIAATIAVHFRIDDLERAKRRVVVPGRITEWGIVGNPYTVAFRAILVEFYRHRAGLAEFIPEEERVEFIFDRLDEAKVIARQWDSFLVTSPANVRPHLPIIPRFEDDEEFLPLQGADLFAGMYRRSLEGIGVDPANGQKVKKDSGAMEIYLDEDTMVRNFIAGISHDLPEAVIYDLGIGVPRPWEGVR